MRRDDARAYRPEQKVAAREDGNDVATGSRSSRERLPGGGGVGSFTNVVISLCSLAFPVDFVHEELNDRRVAPIVA